MTVYRPFPALASLLATGVLLLTACSAPTTTATDQGSGVNMDDLLAVQVPTGTPSIELEWADGPHAPADRKVEERVWAEDDTVKLHQVDVGNVTVGGFTAPARGTFAESRSTAGPKPLIVISHLRGPNCTGENYTYPCPSGTEEIRYDRGMNYLAHELAAQGYDVLIPDLGPVFIGLDVEGAYDQRELWKAVVTELISAAQSPNDATGITLDDAGDLSKGQVGLLVHSRSASMIEAAHEIFGDGLKSVMAYGPYYATETPETFAPALPDVPYLSLTGELDQDVKTAGNRLLTRYLATPRTTPAYDVQVEGLGHLSVNRVLSAAGVDDRVGCDLLDCPDTATHEKVLTESATSWFEATMPVEGYQMDAESDIDLASVVPASSAALPTSFPQDLAGLPTRWLAATHRPEATRLTALDLTHSGDSTLCTLPENVVAAAGASACHEPRAGVAESTVPLLTFTHTTLTGSWPAADALALHLMPFGAPADQQGLQVTITTDRGRHTATLPASTPAIAGRVTDYSDGYYMPSTARLALPKELQGATVTSIELQGGASTYALAGVDIW